MTFGDPALMQADGNYLVAGANPVATVGIGLINDVLKLQINPKMAAVANFDAESTNMAGGAQAYLDIFPSNRVNISLLTQILGLVGDKPGVYATAKAELSAALYERKNDKGEKQEQVRIVAGAQISDASVKGEDRWDRTSTHTPFNAKTTIGAQGAF